VRGNRAKGAARRRTISVIAALLIAGCHERGGDWNNQSVIDTNVSANESIANTLNSVEPPIVSNQGTVPPSNSSAPATP